jgi:nitrous oxidase accessory protein NosD
MHRLIAAASAAVAGFMLSLGAAGGASAAGPQVVVVTPGQSIQNAVNQAAPGAIILLAAGVYHQSVQIRTDGITLRGAGDTAGGTIIEPPAHLPGTICNNVFGGTGICVLAAKLNTKTGKVITPVDNVTVSGLSVRGFPSNGIFGYGTSGLTVRNVTARNDGDYGISRFASTGTRFVSDAASGNAEAGFYVGDSPDAATVVHNDRAWDNEFGILIRHARGVLVSDNVLRGNCQGIILVDDGQQGGVGNSRIAHNSVSANNRFCPRTSDVPVALHGGGILLLGATDTLVSHNSVYGNTGRKINSGGIRVVSAASVTGGSNPDNDHIVANSAHRNKPADLIWDGTGTGNAFSGNHCTKSVPAHLCG